MCELTFAEIRRDAPAIVVSRNGDVTVLVSQETDAQYDERPYSNHFLEGTGSKRRPFTYLSAAPVSAHYAIVDLGFRFRRRKRPVFIEVNDWVFHVESLGIRTWDNQFIRLLPMR